MQDSPARPLARALGAQAVQAQASATEPRATCGQWSLSLVLRRQQAVVLGQKRTHIQHGTCRGSDSQLIVGSGPAVLPDNASGVHCLALALGEVSHGDGVMNLRFNCARHSLDFIQV